MRWLVLVCAFSAAALQGFALDTISATPSRITEGQTVLVRYQDNSHVCAPFTTKTVWIDFGDGSFAQNEVSCGSDDSFSVSHYYANNLPGTNRYVLRGIYTDNTITETNFFILYVTNVPPAVSSFTGLVARATVPWTNRVSFSDPGADTWTATINYGDGSALEVLNLGTNKSFQFRHTYPAKGTYGLNVAISDGDDLTTQTAQVLVNSFSNEPPQLSIHTLPGIVIDGTVGATYEVQHSTLEDTNWITSATLTLSNFVQLWVDTEVTNGAPKRFYRAVERQ